MKQQKIKLPIKTKPKKVIPFDFVLGELAELEPYVRSMFGAYAVYIENKIVFILRQRESYPDDNGVWVCTSIEHHESLRKEFKNMRSLGLFDIEGPTSWQNLPEGADDFEASVLRACELVIARDERIGKYPKLKKKKATVKKVASQKSKKISKTTKKNKTT